MLIGVWTEYAIDTLHHMAYRDGYNLRAVQLERLTLATHQTGKLLGIGSLAWLVLSALSVVLHFLEAVASALAWLSEAITAHVFVHARIEFTSRS